MISRDFAAWLRVSGIVVGCGLLIAVVALSAYLIHAVITGGLTALMG